MHEALVKDNTWRVVRTTTAHSHKLQSRSGDCQAYATIEKTPEEAHHAVQEMVL